MALSLAGLDSERAWKMREELLAAGAGKGYIAQGINGDYITGIAWRKRIKIKLWYQFWKK